MKVVVSGSSGLIGTALARSLRSDGHQVTRLVRRGPTSADEVQWDPAAGSVDAAGLEGHDAAVNLAGVGIGDHRWTDDHKAAVLESRVKSTSLLAETLAGLDRPPTVLVSGSASGYYGDRGDEELTEESPPGTGFLSEVVQAWEAATDAARSAPGMRVACVRTGVVQSAEGGALAKQLLPFKAGLGGRLGSGKQWFPWISIDDEVGAIRHVLDTADLDGPVNLTAPEQVTNAEFTRTLGHVLHRPTALPTPLLPLRLAFGRQMVAEMILAGQRIVPARLTATGYRFRHPTLSGALAAVLGREPS